MLREQLSSFLPLYSHSIKKKTLLCQTFCNKINQFWEALNHGDKKQIREKSLLKKKKKLRPVTPSRCRCTTPTIEPESLINVNITKVSEVLRL